MTSTKKITDLFSTTYEESRQKFINSLSSIRQVFPNAALSSHRLTENEDLTIDWITALPERKDRVFILTTGQHGIEGYTGAAIQQLFIQEFLPQLLPESTGLLLVHAINPWGMKHRRKVNANNVDLNRNFNMHPHEFDPLSNPAARKLKKLVYPHHAVRAGWLDRAWFILKVLGTVLRVGRKDFMAGSLMGQYCFPEGIYFGGESPQEETSLLMDLFQTQLSEYPRVLHLDMHTGYGPRYQMSLVNSVLEPASSPELSARFHYPLVQKTDASEFYTMHGDMIDYMHRLKAENSHIDRFYSSSFEFGTYGESVAAGIRSLRIMVFEMQYRRFGVKNEYSRRWIERQFDAMYDVREPRWMKKAVSDARQAFTGILSAEGYFK
jgi:hypothetical protein